MECRMCGYKFDENDAKNNCGCGCSKCDCNMVICPNCGYGNSSLYEGEFKFLESIKAKLKI